MTRPGGRALPARLFLGVKMVLNVDFDGDVQYAENDLPGTITWGGDDYTCVVGTVAKGERLEGPIGYAREHSFIVVIRTALFTGSRPVAGEPITFNGTEFRIVTVETDEADAALNLLIEEVTA